MNQKQKDITYKQNGVHEKRISNIVVYTKKQM